MKELFLNHLVYTSSNLKKILIFLVVNFLGISTVIGIPVVVIFDLAFIYYNLNKIFKKQGGVRFLLKINDILWFLLLLVLMFFIIQAII